MSTMGSKHSGLARRYLEEGFGRESMHHYGVVTACEQRVPQRNMKNALHEIDTRARFTSGLILLRICGW